MTEAGWLESVRLPPMLRLLDHRDYRRKLRLFCCACCRLVWSSITDASHTHAIEVAEQFADGLVDARALKNAQDRIIYHYPDERAVEELSFNVTFGDDWLAFESVLQTADTALRLMHSAKLSQSRQSQCDLLRHIIGNPFPSYPAPDHWPANVTHLANALYHGADCGFALHDPLAEAGHPELADHFRKEQVHPKGCWAVDLLLRKK